ncbi:winged helix-turn-helix transcriptional regulator [Streptomyces sp. NA02950]|uniref:winged helix-turn-helix domain-containing protein n=1 Tax=Streptomyces sp. NA02950 TaxID=2742137 RepID=UPI0015912450|nr:winged helix-turn-helix domain-containing protein [Streptomyces sp. NA02950]QKV93955.1 winged helix-turn-helix transcriptional regulator [Streptomyces sp. NA02950]
MNEKIAADLREEITAGKHKPGDKMPSVREIADRFAVSAGTASKALQLLSKWGVVHPDSTRGYFVSAQSEPTDEQAPSPEFLALMQEIKAIRDDVTGLKDRLRHLEERIESE